MDRTPGDTTHAELTAGESGRSLTLTGPELTIVELRVLGCLVEKELTTPDQYPLTLNALVLACNQRSIANPCSISTRPPFLLR